MLNIFNKNFDILKLMNKLDNNNHLLIIGNGWDLYRGLSITYDRFYEWIVQKTNNQSEWWSDITLRHMFFRQNINKIDYLRLISHLLSWYFHRFENKRIWGNVESAIGEIFKSIEIIDKYLDEFNDEISYFNNIEALENSTNYSINDSLYLTLAKNYKIFIEAFKEYIVYEINIYETKVKNSPETTKKNLELFKLLKKLQSISIGSPSLDPLKTPREWFNIINFNYTNILDNFSLPSKKIYNIHGKINKNSQENNIVFGSTLQEKTDKDFMNIKKSYQRADIHSDFEFQQNYKRILFFGFSFSRDDYYFLKSIYNEKQNAEIIIIDYEWNDTNGKKLTYYKENKDSIYKSYEINNSLMEELRAKNKIKVKTIQDLLMQNFY